MSAMYALMEAATEAGWDEDDMLGVACEYIDNQHAETSFRDFLAIAVQGNYHRLLPAEVEAALERNSLDELRALEPRAACDFGAGYWWLRIQNRIDKLEGRS